MKRNCFAVMVLVALTGPASAADVWHSSTVRSVYPQADGSFILIFHADSSACTNTNSPKYYHVAASQNGVTSEGLKKLYAAALLAKGTNERLVINFSDSTAMCYVNRVLVGE